MMQPEPLAERVAVVTGGPFREGLRYSGRGLLPRLGPRSTQVDPGERPVPTGGRLEASLRNV